MIPKVVHYCWFGGNQLPDDAKKCIESWRKFFPEYEIKEYRIRKAQFVLTAELMERYFAGFKTRKPAMEWVEEALRKRQFVRFDLGTLGI